MKHSRPAVNQGFLTFGATFLKFTYYFRIRLCFADFFKYRLCGLSLCIQQDSFLFNFVFSCRFCLSAFHSSNSLFSVFRFKERLNGGQQCSCERVNLIIRYTCGVLFLSRHFFPITYKMRRCTKNNPNDLSVSGEWFGFIFFSIFY